MRQYPEGLRDGQHVSVFIQYLQADLGIMLQYQLGRHGSHLGGTSKPPAH